MLRKADDHPEIVSGVDGAADGLRRRIGTAVAGAPITTWSRSLDPDPTGTECSTCPRPERTEPLRDLEFAERNHR